LFLLLILPLPPRSTLFPYTTLFRSVRPQNAELTAVDLVHPVGNVDLHLAALGQRLGRVVDDGAFVQAGIAELRDRHLKHAIVLRSEEHTSELQSLTNLVCRLLLEKK